ncbi:sulfotransferase 1B1-like [Haliotis rubra]|uniref:sulfotransferase 1B1-like n=1 Tax=Haliotis rubra TaxID=36100 RepID=UPI001EE5F5C5|nr:sulfotransferase 1B1-like [Haliotis rubra]
MSTRAEEGMRAGFSLKLTMFEDMVVPCGIIPILSSFRTREVRDDDIFLCTYPKSGTHWTWEILNMIVKGEAKYTEHWLGSSYIDQRNEDVIDAIASPRILTTHMIPRILPRAIWERKCRIINVQRNPKDVAVSYFFQSTNQNWMNESAGPSFTGSWDNFLDAFIKGNIPNDSAFDHTLSWNKVPGDYPDVPFLQLHYEDLKKNAVKVVKQLAEFILHPLPDKVYEEIAEACGFTKLKHAHTCLKKPMFSTPWKEGSPGHFRKGETGDWKHWFTVAQSERFDRIYQQKFHRTFPY